MASVEFSPSAEADIRGLALEPDGRVALVSAIIHNLADFPSRFPACPSVGPDARKYNEGAFLVVFDVIGPAGFEAVSVLMVLPAKGRLAAMAVT